MDKVVLNWSSGKDAAMAYWLLQQNKQYEVTQLLTTISAEHERIVMHGVREELLDAQAVRMGLPLSKIYLPAQPDDALYKTNMLEALEGFKKKGIQAAAFGDIFLEDLKAYREQQLALAGMNAVFPLWGRDTISLVKEVEDAGIDAVIVCVNEKILGKEFLGRKVGRELLAALPANVDACGENGEFHTFVYNAPFFSAPVPIRDGEVVYKQYLSADSGDGQWDTGFYFLDLLPADQPY